MNLTDFGILITVVLLIIIDVRIARLSKNQKALGLMIAHTAGVEVTDEEIEALK